MRDPSVSGQNVTTGLMFLRRAANAAGYVPKQLPLYGMNILQAVAMGSSADMRVFMITSSTRIMRAETAKQRNNFDQPKPFVRFEFSRTCSHL